MSHPLKRHHKPTWPNYKGTPHYVGTSASGKVAVYVDPSLGALYAKLMSDGQSNAWPKFQAAAKALPQIVNDDPFGAGFGAGKMMKGRAPSKKPKRATVAPSGRR